MSSSDRITLQHGDLSGIGSIAVCAWCSWASASGEHVWTVDEDHGSWACEDEDSCRLRTLGLLGEARGWLSDCEWRETELLAGEDRREFFDGLSDAVVTRAVERHFDGGLAAFVAASGLRGF